MAISAVMGVDHCCLPGYGIAAILPENAFFVKVRYERCFIRTVLLLLEITEPVLAAFLTSPLAPIIILAVNLAC